MTPARFAAALQRSDVFHSLCDAIPILGWHRNIFSSHMKNVDDVINWINEHCPQALTGDDQWMLSNINSDDSLTRAIIKWRFENGL
jgi:hypothetical protein